jgi:hypothetical protein
MTFPKGLMNVTLKPLLEMKQVKDGSEKVQ